MSIVGPRPWRPVRRGLAAGALLALLAIAVLAVLATRDAGGQDRALGTRTGTAGVTGIEMVVATLSESSGGSEAGLSIRPGAALLLLLPASGAGLGVLAVRRARAAS